MIQFAPAKFVGRKPFEKRDRGQNVAVASYRNSRGAKTLGEQPLRGGLRETPTVASLIRLIRAEAANSGQGGQQCATRLQYPVQSGDGALQVEDVMQRLREDDAIESPIRNARRRGQVSDNRGALKSRLDVKHVLVGDAGSAEAA